MKRKCIGCKAHDFADTRYCSLGFKRNYIDGGYIEPAEECPKPLSTAALAREYQKQIEVEAKCVKP